MCCNWDYCGVLELEENRMEAERVVVIGLGRSGKSVAHFLAQKGVRVLGVDSSPQALCACPYVHR